jgi:predicted phage baseplate assembly protein
MPIPLPNLDDRRWADLVEDGRASIPRYAPQWTDYNLHDPGITLIDLFAWLAEMTNYRLNRIPARHKRKFLELLGFDISGPAPARAPLSFSPPPATPPFLLPAGSEFEGTDPDQNRIPFRALRDTTLQASAIEAVLVDDGSGTLVDRTHDFMDRFPIEPLGSHPQAGAAFYLGFDALTPGLPLTIGLLFSDPGNDRAERSRILQEAAEQAAECQPVTTRIQCTAPAPPAPVGLPPHQSAGIVWEAFTTSGWTAIPANDDSRSLTLDGLVDLTPPATVIPTTLLPAPFALFYIRCRMTAGAFDAIPILLDAAANAVPCEQAVPVIESFVIKSGITPTGVAPSPGSSVQLTLSASGSGVIQSLAFGAGSGPQARVWSYTAPTAGSSGEIALDLELVGIGAGLPGQVFVLRQPQADASSVSVYTLAGAVWQQWSARNDFDASTRTDFHYVLDAASGTITFGSGERGQTPPADCLILVSYRTTFAERGNIAAGAVNRPRQSKVNGVLLPPAIQAQLQTTTTNREGAWGGAAAETLDRALGRAVEVLHAHERLLDLAQKNRTTTLDQVDGATVRALVAPRRGVNLLDLERIALAVPGTRVARAHAWASLHPDFPCLDAPGLVTVVIVPEYPVGMPVPSPGLLDRVWRYLNRRRMVATTLEVVGPSYVQVTVTATAAIRTGSSAASVVPRIVAALNTFLSPLTGGPDSFGWPFGRSVYRAEILRLIQDVPGVDHVVTLSMQSDSGGPQCGDIALCPTVLARAGTHQIEVL